MERIARSIWLTILVLALGVPSAAFASSGQKRAHGAVIFRDSGCSHCHSIRGMGGSKGPDLSGVGRKLKDAQIRQQIVAGSNTMPAFGDVLQQSELTDLVAYLHSCRDKNRK